MNADHDLTARRPVAIDLFAGAGGLSLGLEQAGFDILAAVDYDPVHAAVHAYNFPLTASICASASTLESEKLLAGARQAFEFHYPNETWDGEVDLVAGGPPCQGFSTIGKRQFDDARNDLVFHFWRLIEEIRPRYFVMENVPGMATGRHAEILHDLVGRFRQIGYAVPEHRILDASDYGVPQARRRLVLIGSRDDVAVANHPRAVSQPRMRRSQPVAATGLPFTPTVLDAIGDLPDLDHFKELLDSDSVRLTPTQLTRFDSSASEYARKLRGLCDDDGNLSYPRAWNRSYLTSSARTVHTELSVKRFSQTLPGTTEAVSRFLRLDPAGLCNTLRAGTGAERGAYTSPRPIHPVHPRVISVREAARLHSFPDWFRLHATKWHGFRQIGNAVCPLLGRAIGMEIVRALKLRTSQPQRVLELADPRLLNLTMKEAALEMKAVSEALPGRRKRLVSRVGTAA